MKKAYLFCTKFRFYLCEIPPVLLLIITILNNKESTGVLKLYPLIIFSIASIVFIFLYFFRMITISFEEIKTIGMFSSKDSVIINKDKTLIFTFYKRKKMTVRLYGNNGTPSFSWAKGDGYQSQEIDLFREKAVGNLRSIKKTLAYFEIPKEDIKAILTHNDFSKVYDNFIVSKLKEEDKTTVSIKFTKTI